MPSITANIPSLNAQANLSRTQSKLASVASSLSSRALGLGTNNNIAAELAAQKERANAAQAANAAHNATITKGQTEEANLANSGDIINKMSEMVRSAIGATGADRDAINGELSSLKNELQGLASTSSSGALNTSYQTASGTSYHAVNSAAGQGSREISVSASTTNEELFDMISALGSMQKDVTAARNQNGETLTQELTSQTNALTQSAKDAGLNVVNLDQADTSALRERARLAMEELQKTSLSMANNNLTAIRQLFR
jgi:flagellin